MQSPTPRLLLLLACTLLGCSSAPAEPGTTGDDPTGDATTGAVTTGDAPPTVAELASCDEVDLEPVFFMGPAFDPETGALLEPLPLPHIVATTAGWHTPEQLEPLSAKTEPVIMDVFAHEGLLGASFGLSDACGSARTLSLWRDEASLMLFVFGKVHGDAISTGLQYTTGWETTHWTETTRDQPPTWEQARARLDALRK